MIIELAQLTIEDVLYSTDLFMKIPGYKWVHCNEMVIKKYNTCLWWKILVNLEYKAAFITIEW